MNRWKQQGGIGHLEAKNNISVYSLSVDIFTLRKSYFGTFDICGELHVSENARFDQDVSSNNLTVSNDISCNQFFAKNKSTYLADVDVSGNLTVFNGNVRVFGGNVDLSQNVFLRKKLFLGNSGLYVNGTDSVGNIGINTDAPLSALDFRSTQPFMLNLATSNAVNYSVLSRTGANKGALLYSNGSSARLDFFVDGSVNLATADARLQYSAGGNFTIDVSNNVSILSNVSVSSRSNGLATHIMGETQVVYDNSGGSYMFPIYENSSETTGNALTLVANDGSSNTFMNIIASNQRGMRVGGGVFPNDQTRAMGTIGVQDASGTYTPAINVVSGNSRLHRNATVAINTHSPEIDNYNLDVNGQTKLKNGQLTMTVCSAEIRRLETLKGNPQYAIAVGSPYDLSGHQQILYTATGGETWTAATQGLAGTTLETNSANINCAYLYDASLAFFGATDNVYFSHTSGRSWLPISNIPTGEVCAIYATGTRAFVAYSLSKNIYWFDFSAGIYNSISGFDSNAISSGTFTVLGTGTVKYICGSGTNMYVAFQQAIYSYSAITTSVSLAYSYSSTTNVGSYRHISTFNSTTILAVGVSNSGRGVISYSTNAGVSWTDVVMGISVHGLNSVSIIDASNAIAVGDQGAVVYSADGYQTWQSVQSVVMNSSGIGARLLDTSRNLTTVAVLDINNFYITKTVSAYSLPVLGNTSLFHCYVPSLFNNAGNYVMDVSGSVRVSGDVNVNDGGRVQTNSAAFYLLNTTAQSIYFGGAATNIQMGNSGGTATVAGTAVVQNGMFVQNGNAGINRLTAQSGYALDVSGNVFVSGNTKIVQNVDVSGNIRFAQYVFGSYYDSANSVGDINIGGLNNSTLGLPGNPTSRNIRIGNFNTTVDMSSTVFVGGAADKVVLGGSVINNMSLKIGPKLFINYAAIPGSSPGSGVYVGDNSVIDAGYMVASSDRGGYVFKATNAANTLKLDVSNLTYSGAGTLNQGILTLSKITGGTDASYAIEVGSVDLSSVFVKNAASSTATRQIVDTSMSVIGQTSLGKSTSVLNTALDVSGNVLVSSRLGVGTAAVSGSYVIESSGDSKLGGNVLVSSRLDVSGNTNMTGNLTVGNGLSVSSGNVLVTNGYVGINKSSVDAGYALDVNGNLAVSSRIISPTQQFYGYVYVTASSRTLSVAESGAFVFVQNSATITLPPVSGNNGIFFYITCAAPCTITTPSGQFTPYPSASSINILAGGSVHVRTDGNNWGILGGVYDCARIALSNLYTGASNAFNGNVGIGVGKTSITSPYALDVSGDTFISGNILTGASQSIVLKNSTNTGINFGTVGMASSQTSKIYDNGDLHVWTNDNFYVDVNGTCSNPAAAPSGASTMIYANNSGVGINKNSVYSGYALDVNGATYVSANLVCGANISSQGQLIYGYQYIGGTSTFSITAAMSGWYFYVDAGYVGGISNVSIPALFSGAIYYISCNSSCTITAVSGNFVPTYTSSITVSAGGCVQLRSEGLAWTIVGGNYNCALLSKNNIFAGNLIAGGATTAIQNGGENVVTNTSTLGLGFGGGGNGTLYSFKLESIPKNRGGSYYDYGTQSDLVISRKLTNTYNSPVNGASDNAYSECLRITGPIGNGVGGGVGGYVGINTSAPTCHLDVSGNVKVGGNLTVANGFTVSAGTVSFPASSINANAIIGGATVAGINSSGNVGINKSSATNGYALDVNGKIQTSGGINFTSYPTITMPSASSDPTTGFISGDGTTASFRLYEYTNSCGYLWHTNGLSFGVGGAKTAYSDYPTPVMQITIGNTGVSINKSSVSAGYALDVYGNTNISGNLTVGNGFTVSAGTVSFPPSSINANAISGGVNVAGINSSGNVGINKSSATNGYALDVNGNANISGNAYAASFNASSDRRLKQNIAPMSPQKQNILSLDPVSFEWRGNGKSDRGFIAQEVHRVFPHLAPPADEAYAPDPTTGEPERYHAIDYGKMTPYLWSGVRELIHDNDTLCAENAGLKLRVSLLEDRMAKLEAAIERLS